MHTMHVFRRLFLSPREVSLGKEHIRRLHLSFDKELPLAQSYKAAVCEELGKPLVVKDVASQEELKRGEVCVEVHNAGVNFADILMCSGQYQVRPDLPFIPGVEISGLVMKVGEGVHSFRPGDRVMGLTGVLGGKGGFGQMCVTHKKLLWHIPEVLHYRPASGLLASYGTAMMALQRRARVVAGETVLVLAAAGATGLAAVDIAANVFKTNVIAACGSSEKCALAKAKGAHHLINYSEESLKERVLDITSGRGANVIFDPVGGEFFKDALKSIAVEGRLVVIGFASGDIPKIPANVLLLKSCSVMGLYWGSFIQHNPGAFTDSVDKVVESVDRGKIRPHVSKMFPLNKVNEAFDYIKSRKSTGKVILDVTRSSLPADKII
ncbi:quinone oxidoreductase-like protein 2 [Lingula anatina]|uniref:Quinone oxidoreductase-like protein 2 n=1 Tax=Lingula anatina TaxID=7574 RepID=A0A1S3IJS2_LINAN|nr:quinone oxidoreductase-like protein 2 [Lingula anatina]|eukprot:XP_013398462.1 quinone oxidoreductase-like protein 2 [Lingula anatina]